MQTIKLQSERGKEKMDDIQGKTCRQNQIKQVLYSIGVYDSLAYFIIRIRLYAGFMHVKNIDIMLKLI